MSNDVVFDHAVVGVSNDGVGVSSDGVGGVP